MAIHIIDLMIDLFGEVEEVYCQSFRLIVPNDHDDTTSILFRMKNGMSGYVGTLLATHPAFRMHVWGSDGSTEIRNPDMGTFLYTPNNTGQITGAAGVINTVERDFSGFDTLSAELEAFADAASGGAPYPVTPEQAIHGCAVCLHAGHAETGAVPFSAPLKNNAARVTPDAPPSVRPAALARRHHPIRGPPFRLA